MNNGRCSSFVLYTQKKIFISSNQNNNDDKKNSNNTLEIRIDDV